MEHVDELISAYLDNELTEAERVLVELHIGTCKECRALVEDFLAMKSQLFTVYQSIEIPDNLEQRVLASLEQKPKTTTRRYTVVPWVLTGSAVTLLLLFMVSLSPLATLSIGLFSSLVTIMVSVLQVVPVFAASLPSLFIGIAGVTVFLLFLLIWSLRRFLLIKIPG
jgi:anti-sigma factor RsiW